MFFKTTIINWRKYPSLFVLRLFSLTVSITFLILIITYLTGELSYDKHISNRNNIYRVLTIDETNVKSALTPFPLRQLITSNVPEIRKAFRFSYLGNITIKKGEENIRENNFYCADSEIFKTLSIDLLFGNYYGEKAINKVAISKKISQKYFGENNSVGKVLQIVKGSNTIFVKVVAIFNEIPKASTFHADIIGDFNIAFDLKENDFSKYSLTSSWYKKYFTTYLLLNENSDKALVENKINHYIKPSTEKSGSKIELQCLTDIYFGSQDITNNFLADGSIRNVKMFSIICVIMFLVATSNFMLMSMSLHHYRRHEYFVRTINGANRNRIVLLIAGEIYIIIFIALLLSSISVYFTYPSAAEVFQKQILLFEQTSFMVFTLVSIVVLTIGAVSCVIIANSLNTRRYGSIKQYHKTPKYPPLQTNKLLVYFQIAIFSALIVITSIILSQWQYLKNGSSLGYDTNELLVLSLPKEFSSNSAILENKLKQSSQIINISVTTSIPLYGPFSNFAVYFNHNYSDQTEIEGLSVDDNFFETLKIKIVTGRSFDLKSSYDEDNSIILNESAAKYLKIDNPIGEKVSWREIVGVVSDFQMHSMYSKVSPLVFFPINKNSNFIIIRYKGDQQGITKLVSNIIKEISPLSSFTIRNFNEIIDRTYEQEKRLKVVFMIFTFIALIIGTMGIFGLLIFSIQKRTKEITIRLIHGANTRNLVLLFAKELILALLIANIITYPLIYYFANEWLNNFEYHINISIFHFLPSTLATIAIIVTSIYVLLHKFANRNPTDIVM